MSTAPRQILIIRHREKPGNPSTESPGESPDLSTQGYERAASLATYVPAMFGKPDVLFADPKCAGKCLLICWHHGKIPELASALGGVPPTAHSKGHVFDRVWTIDYPAGGATTGLPVADIPQMLMYGDSST